MENMGIFFSVENGGNFFGFHGVNHKALNTNLIE